MDAQTNKPATRVSRRTLLVFEVAGQEYAVQSSRIEQVAAMAELLSPPGMPRVLLGFLNLAGELIPVVCLRRLFGKSEASPGIWSPLVILRKSEQRVALLVDKVARAIKIADDDLLALPSGHVLNDCAEGILRMSGDSTLVLSPERLLLDREREVIAGLQQIAEARLLELEGLTT